MRLFSRTTWYFDFLRIYYHIRHKVVRVTNQSLSVKDLFEGFHDRIWREAAKELAVDLVKLPYGFHEAGSNGCSTRIQDHVVELDHHLKLLLARNKPLVSTLLAERGIHVPPFHAFTLEDIASARQFLDHQNNSCVVKPALGCAGGEGVTTHVTTQRELTRAAVFASIYSSLIMIERQIPGDVYRLLYLDGELIDAIRRLPPHVVGDGRSTIRRLIAAENRRRVERSGMTALKILVGDFDCRTTLRRAGLSLNSIPQPGQVVVVKTATNESAAHECEAVRDEVHDDIVREGARAAQTLGIRLAGLDVITSDVGVPLEQSGGAIIEVNSSPGLHYHYQVKNVEDQVPVAVPILRRLLNMGEPQRAE